MLDSWKHAIVDFTYIYTPYIEVNCSYIIVEYIPDLPDSL